MALISINPASGETLREFKEWSAGEVQRVLDDVHVAWSAWRYIELSERGKHMSRLASVLRGQRDDLAKIISLEMGKPIMEARAEVEKCAMVCEHSAAHAAEFLSPEFLGSDASRSYVRFDPLGVILAVMPWNFPFWQVFRFAAPALMAGNGVLLKHASNTTWCSLSIEGLLVQSGFPEDVFRSVLAGSSLVAGIIANPKIAGVTLTGSAAAGRAVGEAAGRALKKTVMELGGSDPFIVLKDADLDFAAGQATLSRTLNCGQSCIAAKRFIVEKPVLEPFLTRFRERMEALVVGDPLSEETQVGPLARPDLREQLHRQVERSVQQGAEVVLGGKPVPGPGAFYLPTILTGVKPGMPAFDEELFGPVASIIAAEDAEEALQLANDTAFGLGASLWTQNTERAEKLAGRVEAGAVFINGFVKSDPRLPFGGVKESGYGRELSAYGIREFVNIKTVWVR